MHYRRVRRRGDLGPAEPLRQFGDACSVPDCSRPYYGRGLCSMHHQRWWKYGDSAHVRPTVPPLARRGAEAPTWVGDGVSYDGMHSRVEALRGRASAHPCAGCGGEAKDWAYAHGDPVERTGMANGRVLRYSTDPSFYKPLCRVCHYRLDRSAAA